jgi:two-component system OmpR family response regulator
MKNETTNIQKLEAIKIFLVDDDALFLKSLEIDFLEHADFIIETYATGELCVQNLPHNPDVIILDYQLDGIDKTAMNGIETLDKIKAFNPDIPVVMLSAQDKIEVAISCMHHRSFDYVVKSETAFVRLQKIITTIFRYKKMEKELSWYMDRM